MKLGLGLYGNLLTADNFRFAKQAGATHIVAHLPGHFKKAGVKEVTTDGSLDYGFGISAPRDDTWTDEFFLDLRKAVNAEGLELEAIENFEPVHWHDVLLDGPKREAQMAHLKQIIRSLGKAGIPIMGYYFSLAGVWGRTEGAFARGGARSVGYHEVEQTPIPNGMVWNMVYDSDLFDPSGKNGYVEPISHEQIWDRFSRFLSEMMPVAEEANVKLALHPDDPPLPTLRGMARLVVTPDAYQRVLDIVPSSHNCMEFCIGTMTEMVGGANMYDLLERYAKTERLGYIHFRNVRGTVPNYEEVFIDEGDFDMIRAIQILHRNRFEGVMIPDHTPQMTCGAPWHAGMAHALGFMRAALTCVERGLL